MYWKNKMHGLDLAVQKKSEGILCLIFINLFMYFMEAAGSGWEGSPT